MTEITAEGQKKETRMKRIKDSSETSGTILNIPTFKL